MLTAELQNRKDLLLSSDCRKDNNRNAAYVSGRANRSSTAQIFGSIADEEYFEENDRREFTSCKAEPDLRVHTRIV